MVVWLLLAMLLFQLFSVFLPLCHLRLFALLFFFFCYCFFLSIAFSLCLRSSSSAALPVLVVAHLCIFPVLAIANDVVAVVDNDVVCLCLF